MPHFHFVEPCTVSPSSIADVIDFTTPQPNHLGEPHCADTEEETALDLLPSIQDIDAATAQYMAEIGLKDPLQKLGGEDHILAVPVAGTKIADALKLVRFSLEAFCALSKCI